MGTYLNPGNAGFTAIRRSEYVDKSGLIACLNKTIGTMQNLVCVSRPRRFGKSYAAQMLCAYYDRSCDSSALFDDLAIAETNDYRAHLNRYHVIYLDMTYLKPYTEQYSRIESRITDIVSKELQEAYPQLSVRSELPATLVEAVLLTGTQFVMIIDEWDAPIRENPEMEQVYLEFLRTLFKSSGTTARIFAAVYMTGILPIKKDGSQSAISDFEEFTMLKPRDLGAYVGFTESEVADLCAKHQADFHAMKEWYDGYAFRDVGSVYNPNSVMKALKYRDYESYWTATSSADSLMKYLSYDYDGLSKTIAELIGGISVPVHTARFANDLITFHGRDDVLTLLIHLGYLTYDVRTGKARIPNEEIRLEFADAIRHVDHTETLRRVAESDQLLDDTIHLRANAVAAQIERIHAEETTPILYNREDSLRSVIKLAYYTYKDHYLMWEELPAGVGYADVVYFPKRDSGYPALVIELKWNESAEGAIAQIHSRQYPKALEGYGGDILLVGISYDKEAPAGERRHHCRIERVSTP